MDKIQAMAEYILYIIAVAITPGPNCLASLENASQKGLPRCLTLNLGMLCGITVIDTVCYFALSYLASLIPSITKWLQILGAVYLFYLSYCLIRKGHISIGNSNGTFKTGLFMQLFNAKVFMLGVSAISTFVLPMSTSLIHGYLLTMVLPVLCFLCGLVWVVAGVSIAKIYNRYTRIFNFVFAGIIAWQAVKSIISIL